MSSFFLLFSLLLSILSFKLNFFHCFVIIIFAEVVIVFLDHFLNSFFIGWFSLIFPFYVFVVESCDDLNCEENEICVPAGDTYECVCHPDYEGENCDEIGWMDLPFFLHSLHIIELVNNNYNCLVLSNDTSLANAPE